MNFLYNAFYKPRAWICLAIIVGLVVLQIGTLQDYPLPSCDETGYGDAAYSLITSGRPAWSVFPEPDRYGRDINIVHMGRIYLLGLGATFLLLGRSLFAARFYSLVGGLLAAGLTYLVGQKLYNRKVGAAAALVFLTSFKFFLTAHEGRPDIWTTASILASVYLVLKCLEEKPSWKLIGIAGFLAALTLDFHFNAMAFLAASTSIVIWRFGWQTRQWKSVVIFGVGVGVGLVFWVGIHAWPSPSVAWEQLTTFSISYTGLQDRNTLIGLLQNATSFPDFLKTAYIDTPWPISLIETALSMSGLSFAFYRRNPSDKIMLGLVGISVIGFAFLFSQRFIQYSVLWLPLLLLSGFAAVEALTNYLGNHNERLSTLGLWGIAVTIGLIQLGANGWLALKFRESNFEQMEVQLDNTIPPGTRVLADTSWWWALSARRTFLSDEYFIADFPNAEARDVVSAWTISEMQRLHPEYVLLDNAIGCTNAQGPAWTALHQYLTHSCTLVEDLKGFWWNDPAYELSLLGQVTSVYRCSEFHG